MPTRHFFINIMILFCLAVIFAGAEPTAIWLFDDGSGDTVKDSSGHGNDGKLANGVAWNKDGKFGGALSFDGVDDWVEVPDSPDLTPPHITIMAWFKPDNVTGSYAVIEKYDWAASKGTYGIRQVNANVQCYFVWGQDGDVDLEAASVLKPQQWTHIAVTYDGKNGTMYVAGEVKATMNGTEDLIDSDVSLAIGTRGDTHDTHWFAGLIDEVAIFDEALTETDIRKIMEKGIATAMAVDFVGKLAIKWGALKTRKPEER